MKKKIIKKSKKVAKKPRKTTKNNHVISWSRGKAPKPFGEVTHFFGGIKVAIIKFKKPIRVGSVVRVKGATTDFEQKIKSMQYDHQNISMAKKGREVGVKVDKKVRQGDEIFE